MTISFNRFLLAAAAAVFLAVGAHGAAAGRASLPAAAVSATLRGDGSLVVKAILSLPDGFPGSFAVDVAGYGLLGEVGVKALGKEEKEVSFTVDRLKGAAVIRWTCLPAGGPTRFEVSYTLSGALTAGKSADNLTWGVLSRAQEYGFGKLSAALSCPEGEVTVLGGALQNRLEPRKDGLTRLAAEGLPANTPLKIMVSLPKGTYNGGLPWDKFMKTTGGTIALFLLPALSFLGLLSVFWLRGTDPVSGGPVSADGRALEPEIAGTVMDEYADNRDLAAAALDLARAGCLELEYAPAAAGREASLTVKRVGPLEGLAPHRRALAELLCAGAESSPGEGMRVLDEVYAETARRGFFRSDPAAERKAYSLAGAALCGGGILLLALGAITPSFLAYAALGFGAPFALALLALRARSPGLRWALGIGAAAALAAGLAALQPALGAGGLGWVAKLGLGLLFSSFFFFAFAPAMPQRTARGSAEKARLLADRLSLETFFPQPGDERKDEGFQEGLPYAVIYRIRTDWVRKFAAAGGLAPAWWKLRGRGETGEPPALAAVQADFLASLDLLAVRIGELTPAGSGG